MMDMPQRNLGLWFSLDTNRINARQRDSQMNQLEAWYGKGVIDLYMSEPSAIEVKKGGAPQRHKKLQEIGTIMLTFADTHEERVLLRKISNILFGRLPRNENELRDVEIVFNAKKYPGSLITEDTDILNKRHELKISLGLDVRQTSDAITLVQRRIKVRDNLARTVAAQTVAILPKWVGND